MARARRDPAPSRRSSGSSALLASMGVRDVRLTGGEPLVRRDFPRLVGDARRSPASRTSRSPPTATCSSATPRRSWTPASRRVNVSLDSLAARPLLPDDPPRRAAAGAARPRGARGLPRGAPDQGQRRRDARLHRGRGAAASRASPASTPTRCASSSSCRSTPTTAWTPRPGADRRRDPRDLIERGLPARARPSASRTPPRASTASPTGGARSASSTRSREPFCGDCNRIRLTADGQAAHLPVLAQRDRPARAAARGRGRRRARADRPRRGLAQGAQAPRQRAGLPSSPRARCAPSAAEPAARQRPPSSAAACRMSSGPLTLKNGSSSGHSTIARARVAPTSVARAARRSRPPAQHAQRPRVVAGAQRLQPAPAARGTTAGAPRARSRASARRARASRTACRRPRTTTGRPRAQRSAWTMPASGWRGSSGSSQIATSAVEPAAARSTAWPRRRPRRGRRAAPPAGSAAAAGRRARPIALSPPMRRAARRRRGRPRWAPPGHRYTVARPLAVVAERARRARRPPRGRPRSPRCVNAAPSGVWRAAPSSSVPIELRGVQAHLLVGLVDEQLHHVQLVGGQQRDAPREREAGLVELGLGHRLGRQAPLDRAARRRSRRRSAAGAWSARARARYIHIAVVGEPQTRAGG